jgi:VanZ family protein
MFERPPQEKDWTSWAAVVLWSLLIFGLVPVARAIESLVAKVSGPEIYTIAVILVVVLGAAAMTIYQVRETRIDRAGLFWLLLVASVYVVYTIQLRAAKIEALHFILYGVLGLLLYRALTHRVRDIGIYFAAAILGAVVGILDEALQWITPKRSWGLHDIWIDCVGAALMQVAIAMGLQPAIISKRLSAASIRLVSRLAAVALLLLGLSVLNTPPRIAWYSSQIPALAFLKTNESVMLEYGYRYEEPETGVFRSRLTLEELRQADHERAEEGGRILAQYQDRERYREFLELYTPVNDPFLHEARVHLFRRDLFLDRAEGTGEPRPKTRAIPEHVDEFQEQMTVAYRENQILERYFSGVLRESGLAWRAETLDRVRAEILPDYGYESGVSRSVITEISEWQLLLLFVVAIVGVLAAGQIYGRERPP